MPEATQEPQQEFPDEVEPLVPEDDYFTSGVHIGTQHKNADMEGYIYRVRNDGLFVIDIQQTDQRIKNLAQWLGQYDPSDVLLVSARQYGQKPIQVMARELGTMAIAGRFMPGTLTNPETSQYIEPEVLLLTDPAGDSQALEEAITTGIPVAALCDTNNETKNVDLVIPANNKGRRSLALTYWILTRELRKEWGIGDDGDYELEVDDFQAAL